MKKLNRRSKKTSLASPGGPSDVEDQGKRIQVLESENEELKREIEGLKYKLANVSSGSVGLDVDIQKLKVQKVKLQCKSKLDSVQFRICKASLEKEIQQLKKEQRKRDIKISLLLSLTQNLKLRLKLLLGSRKTLSHKLGGPGKGNGRTQDIAQLPEETLRSQKLYADYESLMEELSDEITKFRQEADELKEEYHSSAGQDSEVGHKPISSELKELKEEFDQLSTWLSQMESSKSLPGESEKCMVDVARSSASSVNSIHPKNMMTSSSEQCQVSAFADAKTMSKVCCSCSKRSLCKTPKCQCKASGSSCGFSCGCSTSKCANRKVPVKSEGLVQPQVAQAGAGFSSSGEKENTLVPRNCTGAEKLPEMIDDCGQIKQPLHDCGQIRQPLRDLGNMQVNPVAGKVGAKKQRKPKSTDTVHAQPESKKGLRTSKA